MRTLIRKPEMQSTYRVPQQGNNNLVSVAIRKQDLISNAMIEILFALFLVTIFTVFTMTVEASQSGQSSSKTQSNTANKASSLQTKSRGKKLRVPFKHGLGMKKFKASCAACHGEWAEGTEQGPPLIHGFYKPSHHSDTAFYRAALTGVQAHHWQFGNMPPVEGITRKDMDRIIPYIRWLQKEKGVY